MVSIRMIDARIIASAFGADANAIETIKPSKTIKNVKAPLRTSGAPKCTANGTVDGTGP